MLRITNSGSEREQIWTLCGQLAGPWVEEFRLSWETARASARDSKFIIDLSDVTFIDERGESLLRGMKHAGVEFIASGVDTQHLLQNLMKTRRPSLRRFMDSCTPDGKHH
jgi:anti-anti-sigma regulatory factor